MMMQTTTQKAANPSSSTRDSGGPRSLSAKRPRDDDDGESNSNSNSSSLRKHSLLFLERELARVNSRARDALEERARLAVRSAANADYNAPADAVATAALAALAAHVDGVVDFTDRASIAKNAALVCECLDGIRDYANHQTTGDHHDPVPWRVCQQYVIIIRDTIIFSAVKDDDKKDGPLASYLADWERADDATDAEMRRTPMRPALDYAHPLRHHY